MPPRRKTREESRTENDVRLLEAGRKVFLARGFHGASLEQVSAAAGLTKGAVYARFDSKADLFFALLERHVAERVEEIRAATLVLKTPHDAALAAGRQWLERASRHRGWALLTTEFRVVAARDPALLRRYRTLHQRLESGLAEVFAEVHHRAGTAPAIEPRRWARLALGIGNGLLLERWVEEDDEDAAWFAELCDALARGRTT
jgi:AcrR family transcriptional regulator